MVNHLLEMVEYTGRTLTGIHSSNSDDEFLTFDQAAAFLKLYAATLYSKVLPREIPVIKPEKYLHFKKIRAVQVV